MDRTYSEQPEQIMKKQTGGKMESGRLNRSHGDISESLAGGVHSSDWREVYS